MLVARHGRFQAPLRWGSILLHKPTSAFCCCFSGSVCLAHPRARIMEDDSFRNKNQTRMGAADEISNEECRPSTVENSRGKNSGEEKEAILVASWASSLLCRRNLQCSDGECEKLHVSHEQAERHCRVPPGRGKLIVCAGPERSGSTWLFNALRLLLEGSGERVHSYWLHTITAQKLQKRGLGREEDVAHVLIKTHAWSSQWDPAVADVIVLTDRDVCGVVNSHLRVGWLPYNMSFLKSFLEDYMVDHTKWQNVAHAVLSYEDIIDRGRGELECLKRLAEMLGLATETDFQQVSAAIKALPIPSHGGPDPVSKLWPAHVGSSKDAQSRWQGLSATDCEMLREHVAPFLSRS